jgi:hypothetical protein
VQTIASEAVVHQQSRRVVRRAACLGVWVGIACGGGEGIVTTPGNNGNNNPTPTIEIALANQALTVAAGESGTTSVAIARGGGFTGDVSIAIEGLPAGVTASAAPSTVGAGASTSTITIAVGTAVGAGTHAITVRATGSGVAAKTATISLTIVAVASFALTLDSTAIAVTQGTSVTMNAILTRSGGFTGTVALTAEGLPTGVTAAFNPSSVTGNSSVLTLTAAANATLGTVTVTVRATAAGQPSKTATFQLIVAPPAPSYTLSVAPTSVSVQQGANGTATVTITRTGGFTGTVNLAATGLPNGVTAAFNPGAATGNASALTLTASVTATPGSATITVRGQATGLADRTTTLSLNVTTPVGGSGNTTWEFCTVGLTPIWFAVQDGANGAWTRVNPTGTKFQFNVTQPKAGVAYVVNSSAGSVASASRTLAGKLSNELQQQLLLRNRPTRGNAYAASAAVESFSLNISYGSQAELNSAGTSRCLPGAGKTVNGTVAGLSTTATSQQTAVVSLATSGVSATAANPSFSLKNVPDGNLDLIASRTTVAFSGTDFSITLDKLIIRRGINAANNSTLPVLDFGSSEAFDPVQANLTIANLGAEVAYATTSYSTGSAGNTSATLSAFSTPSSGPFKYRAVPASKQAAGDLHGVFGLALPSATSSDQLRIAGLYFKDPIDRTVTLGPALTVPAVVTVATTPYARLRATGPIQSQYNQAFSLSFSQSNTTLSRSVVISASQAYLSGLTTYDFQVPDFTAVAGWDNNWGPKTGIQTTWSVAGFAFAGGLSAIGTPIEGSGYQGGLRQGQITP